MARRVLANHHRGERRRSALTERLRADLTVAYRPPEFTGELAQLAAALRRLPGPERELLALSAWEGLDNGQIAVVLGCSRNAVRIRLFRARKRFAAELASSRTAPARHRESVPNGDLALNMNQLSQISPISDADAARTVRASTLADLAGQITAT